LRSIEGEVAWITGAGSGIGQAGALALAKAGARVALSGRRSDALESTAALIRDAGAGEALIVPLDVRDNEAVEAAASQVLAKFERIDILVNSAGINVVERAWDVVSPESFDLVLGADLHSAFYTSRAVLPGMRRRGGGLIIQISSWAGRHPSILTGPAYCAAKQALNALSETLNRSECVNGIRSCCICPGETATPILDNRPVAVSDADKAVMLQMEDLGETILFVARMPASVCFNEILMSPTWNRGYVADLARMRNGPVRAPQGA
jgi:NADP-dependent 3-hydroxy acid dehydrogenase YdfG